MYYTQIILNPAHRGTVEIMNDVYKQHKFIMSGFKKYGPEAIRRVLYRMETMDDERLAAIVQSVVSPTYEADLAHNHDVIGISTKEVLFAGKPEPVFNNEMVYRFRLRVNTVVTRDGKRIGLIHENALRDWFERRAEGIGVSLHSYDVIDEGYVRGNKYGKEIIFKIARYEGVLMIRDGEQFTATFISGFGHGKGFGCGLISLAKV